MHPDPCRWLVLGLGPSLPQALNPPVSLHIGGWIDGAVVCSNPKLLFGPNGKGRFAGCSGLGPANLRKGRPRMNGRHGVYDPRRQLPQGAGGQWQPDGPDSPRDLSPFEANFSGAMWHQ